jgi:hypothetical protein
MKMKGNVKKQMSVLLLLLWVQIPFFFFNWGKREVRKKNIVCMIIVLEGKYTKYLNASSSTK